MSDLQQKFKLDGCEEMFTPRMLAHVFHDPKCKAAHHRLKPLEKGVVVTAIESKTGKGGIDSVVRVALDDRTKMAKLFIPGKRYVLLPMNEDLF